MDSARSKEAMEMAQVMEDDEIERRSAFDKYGIWNGPAEVEYE